jgi:hypothetical protein
VALTPLRAARQLVFHEIMLRLTVSNKLLRTSASGSAAGTCRLPTTNNQPADSAGKSVSVTAVGVNCVAGVIYCTDDIDRDSVGVCFWGLLVVGWWRIETTSNVATLPQPAEKEKSHGRQ